MSAAQLLLYEHSDGRRLVALAGNAVVVGDPTWYRAGPVEIDPAIGASAPALLEALQRAVDQYGKPGGPWNVPGDAGSWITQARAAIAAATGAAS